MTPPAALRPAVFLDRDGVINRDTDYLYRIEDFEFLPGVPPALKALQQAGYALVVVTNQSGIARGRFTEADYIALTDHMQALLQAQGVTLDAIQHCPHLPGAAISAYAIDCHCRKPEPGMLLDAAKQLGLDLPRSVMVGDKASDMAAGRAAGVGRCVLVRCGQAISAADEALADDVVDDLATWVSSLGNSA